MNALCQNLAVFLTLDWGQLMLYQTGRLSLAQVREQWGWLKLKCLNIVKLVSFELSCNREYEQINQPKYVYSMPSKM
ncbi:hypothetical protein U876_18010 [Aeromonas hydrophila NJ-35]|nr:hypothetical protein AHML_05740 [Aeromonas hydrophila ML09-119]AHX31636.1 hypothetical protein V428_05960 [Aeromonas hydrophila subsp. hydrophila AL09-71]AHX68432.1 hypothetical protein V429_05960 [Aeromonas hydrophila pc104A]AJE38655.1 hypothetical protein V469_17385 [Aeromonas hydrophila J-1]AKJ37087.1 hypothetical protein U876_18010 [Aeromonas hydrophila NJ-35]